MMIDKIDAESSQILFLSLFFWNRYIPKKINGRKDINIFVINAAAKENVNTAEYIKNCDCFSLSSILIKDHRLMMKKDVSGMSVIAWREYVFHANVPTKAIIIR